MRKNDLLKLLSNIKGNPQLVLWNGFVEDYHHIDSNLVELTLVKHSKEYLKNQDLVRGVCLPEDVYIKAVASQQWELPNEFVTEDEFAYWYGKNQKKVYVLIGKLRGKKQWDRSGSMEY